MNDRQKWEETYQLALRAQSLYDSHNYEGALDYYGQALTLEPNDAWLWLKMGQSFHELRRFKEALDCYDDALGIKSNDDGNKMKFLVWKNDWDNKLAYLILINKGNCLIDMGLIDESVYFFDKANEIAIRSTGNIPDVVDKWLREVLE